MAEHRPFESRRLRRDQGSHIAVIARTADPKPANNTLSRGATLAMVALCAAVFVAALDQTMVLTVMPSIMRSLYIDVRNLNDAGWIITAYLLGYTIAMPLFGRLADVWGRRPTTMVALVLFMVWERLLRVSRPARPLRGGPRRAGGGGRGARPHRDGGGRRHVPARPARSGAGHHRRGGGGRRSPRPDLRGRAGDGLELAAHLPGQHPAVSDPDAGLLATAAARGCYRPTTTPRQPPSRLAQAASRQHWWPGRVDYFGAALMALSLAGITIGLGTGTQMVEPGRSSRVVRRYGGPGCWPRRLAFTAFILYERRTTRPLIRLDLFRKPPFAAANIAHLLVGAALIIGMVEIPLYANTLFGLTEIGSGLCSSA